MSIADERGCALSGATPAAAQAYERALAAYRCWRNGADAQVAAVLLEAPRFVMAHVLQAYLLVCSRDPQLVRSARPVLALLALQVGHAHHVEIVVPKRREASVRAYPGCSGPKASGHDRVWPAARAARHPTCGGFLRRAGAPTIGRAFQILPRRMPRVENKDMELTQLTGKYARLREELARAYAAPEWQGAMIDRLADEIAQTERALASYRHLPGPDDDEVPARSADGPAAA